MADTFYPTGISASPIDLTSGAAAFMKSAVESRLGEIAASREEISENAKNVMKAMSVQAAPELFRAQQDRYNKEIEDYRNSVRDIWKERGGKLTQDDRIKIQRGEEDLRNRMQSELNDLKTFQSYQEKIYDPNFRYAYNPQQYQQILGSAYSRMMKGEGLGNIAAEAAQAQLEPSIGDYTAKRYGNEIQRLSEVASGEFSGNIFTSTSAQDKAEAERLLGTIMQDPNVRSRYTSNDGVVLEDRRQQVEQQVRDYINRTITETKPHRQTTGSGGSTKELIELSPKQVSLASGEYTDYIDYPASQSEKRFTLNEAFNEETGRNDKFDKAASMRVIGFDPSANKVFFVSEGGELKRGNNTLYGMEGVVSNDASISDKRDKGVSEADITNNIKKLVNKSSDKFTGMDDITRVTGLKITKNSDGTITVSGTAEAWRKKQALGFGGDRIKDEANLDTNKHVKEKSEQFSFTMYPLTDPKETTRYSAPLSDYEEVVSELYQYGVGGQKIRDYYKSKSQSGSGTVSYSVDGTTYEIPSNKEKAFLQQFPNAKKQ